jgi:hypothetical protein
MCPDPKRQRGSRLRALARDLVVAIEIGGGTRDEPVEVFGDVECPMRDRPPRDRDQSSDEVRNGVAR